MPRTAPTISDLAVAVNRILRQADPGKLKVYLAAGLPILLTDVPPNAQELAAIGGAEIVPADAGAFADAIERQAWGELKGVLRKTLGDRDLGAGRGAHPAGHHGEHLDGHGGVRDAHAGDHVVERALPLGGAPQLDVGGEATLVDFRSRLVRHAMAPELLRRTVDARRGKQALSVESALSLGDKRSLVIGVLWWLEKTGHKIHQESSHATF